MSDLTHLDEHGAARMVDVSDKEMTAREATAEAIIVLSAEAFAAVMDGSAPKGDVLAAARIAGIMAAKKTSELIPLCHPLPLSKMAIDFEPLAERNAIRIVAMAKTTAQTGVEMEALTAASIAALTVYDMVKAVDKGAVIESVRLLTKSGGKSGAYIAPRKPRIERAASDRPKARAKPTTLNHEAAPPRPQAIRMPSARPSAISWCRGNCARRIGRNRRACRPRRSIPISRAARAGSRRTWSRSSRAPPARASKTCSRADDDLRRRSRPARHRGLRTARNRNRVA